MFIVIRLNNLSFAFISFRAWDSPLITLPIDFSIKQRTNLKGWIKNTNYPRLETLHKCRKQIILSFLKIEYFHKTYELWTPKAIFYYVTFSFFMSWSIWIPLYFKVFGRRSLYFIRPRLLIFINLSIGFAMGFFYVCWIFNVENIRLLLLISKKWWLLVALKKIIVTFSIGQKLIWRELSGFHVDFSNQVVFVRLSVGQETCDMNRRGCFCEDTYKINPPDKNSTVNFTRCVDTQKSRQSSVC